MQKDKNAFFSSLNSRIAEFDLLSHPYYQTWQSGRLSREDIKIYASSYYHHVSAFPEYLKAVEGRLSEGSVKQTIEENRQDEEGRGGAGARNHADIWLDFVEGMGGSREAARSIEPLPGIKSLIDHFETVAENGDIFEAIAAFYAYESQVPRVAEEKLKGLQEHYGADDATSYYFKLHTKYDEHHAQVWKDLLYEEIGNDKELQNKAIDAAGSAAEKLWQALDSVESDRMSRCIPV